MNLSLSIGVLGYNLALLDMCYALLPTSGRYNLSPRPSSILAWGVILHKYVLKRTIFQVTQLSMRTKCTQFSKLIGDTRGFAGSSEFPLQRKQ